MSTETPGDISAEIVIMDTAIDEEGNTRRILAGHLLATTRRSLLDLLLDLSSQSEGMEAVRKSMANPNTIIGKYGRELHQELKKILFGVQHTTAEVHIVPTNLPSAEHVA